MKKSLDDIYAGIAKAIVAYSDKPADIVSNLGIVQIYPLHYRTVIVTRRPGVLIGKRGELIDKISEQIGKVEVIEEDSATHEDHIRRRVENEVYGDNLEGCQHYETHCMLHPLKAGFLFYCSDCDETAEAETPQKAEKKFRNGETKHQSFDRSEF
jgi:hypothetical protein